MDNAYLDSKAPRRTVRDLMWENGGPRVWAPYYSKKYNMKDAEWSFNAVTQMMDVRNVSD